MAMERGIGQSVVPGRRGEVSVTEKKHIKNSDQDFDFAGGKNAFMKSDQECFEPQNDYVDNMLCA